MQSSSFHLELVNLAASIADMKQEQYDEILTTTALISLLIDKGILSEHELLTKKQAMNTTLESVITRSLYPTE